MIKKWLCKIHEEIDVPHEEEQKVCMAQQILDHQLFSEQKSAKKHVKITFILEYNLDCNHNVVHTLYLPNNGSIWVQCKNMAIYQATYYWKKQEKAYCYKDKNLHRTHIIRKTYNIIKRQSNNTYQFHCGRQQENQTQGLLIHVATI